VTGGSDEHGRWRLSDADREQLYERLSRHAAAGRLDLEELERRIAALAAAETREQAAPILADLPPLPPPAAPAAQRRGDAAADSAPRRLRGHGESDRPAPDWQPTGERFRDPRSKRILRVWIDGAGGRHYVPDDDRG